jgi:hypothetical protein
MLYLPLYWSINDVGPAAGGGYDWVLQNGLSSNNSLQTTAASLDYAIGCAYPGFKDFYSEGGWEITFYLNHNNGVLLNQTLKLAAIENKEKIDALQLVTWNDF